MAGLTPTIGFCRRRLTTVVTYLAHTRLRRIQAYSGLSARSVRYSLTALSRWLTTRPYTLSLAPT